jgi:hypothetical protein
MTAGSREWYCDSDTIYWRPRPTPSPNQEKIMSHFDQMQFKLLGLGIGLGMMPSSIRITQAGLDQLGVDVALFSLQSPGQIKQETTRACGAPANE